MSRSLHCQDPGGHLRQQIEEIIEGTDTSMAEFIKIAVEDLIDEKRRAQRAFEEEQKSRSERPVVSGRVCDEKIRDFLFQRAGLETQA